MSLRSQKYKNWCLWTRRVSGRLVFDSSWARLGPLGDSPRDIPGDSFLTFVPGRVLSLLTPLPGRGNRISVRDKEGLGIAVWDKKMTYRNSTPDDVCWVIACVFFSGLTENF